MRHRLALSLALLSTLAAAAAGAAESVNLYSARQEALIKPLLERFTERTGIEVNLVTGSADALIKRLEVEGRNTPADLLITVDAGRLHRAETAGLFQPIESDVITERVPAHLRDDDHHWSGLSQRARVIAYSTERVDPAELSTYEALAEPRWRNRICVRSSDNIYNQSLLASIIAAHGKERATEWAEGIVANMARRPQGGDRDQIMAVAAGVCDVAIVNTYYYGRMRGADARPEQRERRPGRTVLSQPGRARCPCQRQRRRRHASRRQPRQRGAAARVPGERQRPAVVCAGELRIPGRARRGRGRGGA